MYVSIIVLIIAGMIFVKGNRYENTLKVIENLKDKDVIFYSSNFKRLYISSQGTGTGDMEKLCVEGSSLMKKSSINSYHLKIEDGPLDSYAQAAISLDKSLQKKDNKHILLDISRGQTRYGKKYEKAGINLCPISIIISKKSASYDQSLLFMGRVKAVIDRDYGTVPVQIISLDTGDFNQSKGYIAALIELGDAANTYDDAKESLRVFTEACAEVMK